VNPATIPQEATSQLGSAPALELSTPEPIFSIKPTPAMPPISGSWILRFVEHPKSQATKHNGRSAPPGDAVSDLGLCQTDRDRSAAQSESITIQIGSRIAAAFCGAYHQGHQAGTREMANIGPHEATLAMP